MQFKNHHVLSQKGPPTGLLFLPMRWISIGTGVSAGTGVMTEAMGKATRKKRDRREKMRDIVDVGSRPLNGVCLRCGWSTNWASQGLNRFQILEGKVRSWSLFYTRSGESMGSVMVHANVDKHTELE